MSADSPSRKDDLRSRVYRLMVNQANQDEKFKKAVNEMGIFTFFDVIDVVVGAVIDEENERTLLPAELDEARREIAYLRSLIAAAATSLAAADEPPKETR